MPGRIVNEWFPSEVPSNVEIGDHTYFHSSFALHHFRSTRPQGLRIGEHSSIFDSTFFHLGPDAEVSIGDYSLVWGAIICSNARVSIGNYAFISNEVFIADRHAPITPMDHEYPSDDGSADISIGDECWLGVRSCVLGGAKLGRGVIVGAGAVVDFEVPPYAIIAGSPARIVSWAKPGEQKRRQAR